MNHLELFAGIGGFRRAMDLLMKDHIMNFNCVGYSEIDPRALTTYEANYHIDPKEVKIGDIVSFTKDKKKIEGLPAFDLLTGGFPCQSFSLLGNRLGFDDEARGQMFFRIIDILRVKRPKYVLLENVKNLKNHDKGNTLKTVVKELENLDYTVFYDVFNTLNFGLPQQRNRILIFATQVEPSADFVFTEDAVKKAFASYQNTSLQYFFSTLDILEKKVDPKYFLSDKMKYHVLDLGGKFGKNHTINNLKARTLVASLFKMHRAGQDNYYSSDFIESNGAINKAKKLSQEEQINLSIRRLTPTEAFLLQGFPRKFIDRARAKKVSDSALYKQAGNAVSVNTIYSVLRYLVETKAIKP